MSIFLVTSLDYIIGVYPLLLILITYFLVKIHDRYVVTSQIWRPLFKPFSLFKGRNWNIKTSLIKAFATFFVLSYVKVLDVSRDLLTSSFTYYNDQHKSFNSLFVFINGSVEYGSKDHVPYFILAIIMSLIFNILPLLLLCVYPCSWFLKCLNRFKCKCLVIHLFMDTFQGCYREKPFDCRSFAGYYIFLRIANSLVYGFTKSFRYHLIMTNIMLFTVILIAAFKPYKRPLRNTIDIVLFLIAVSCYVMLFGGISIPYLFSTLSYTLTSRVYNVVILLVIPIYGVFLLLFRISTLLIILFPNSIKCRRLYIKLSSLLKRKEISLESSLSLDSERDEECRSLLK